MEPTTVETRKYMVVIAFSVSDLEAQVNEFIRIGWKPIGGVWAIDKDTYDNGEIENNYLQAMTTL